MKTSIFVVVLLAFVAKQVSSQACHMRELDLCMAIGMFHYQSNGVPGDEEKVDEWCETVKEVSDCMGNYSSKCLSPLQKEIVGLFSGAEEPATNLCTKGSESRARYLKHASCISEGADSDTFKSHIKDFQVALEAVFEAPFFERLPGLCCGFKRFFQNTERSTSEMCGDDAVEMTRYIMKMLTTDLPEVICQRFDAQSEECQKLLPPIGTPTKGAESKSQIGRLLDTVFGNM